MTEDELRRIKTAFMKASAEANTGLRLFFESFNRAVIEFGKSTHGSQFCDQFPMGAGHVSNKADKASVSSGVTCRCQRVAVDS